jgi:KUP system potassium uptake protein
MLTLGALGVVFGDIGTSPLYALRECLHANMGIATSPENILGILSLIFWALILMISIKYLAFVMRANNDGEGGVLALLSLGFPERRLRLGATTQDRRSNDTGSRRVFILLGLVGSALLYGDGMLTPAITVLSAIEGLEIATPAFDAYVLPITICILIVVFMAQRFGTATIGAVFGPVILLWFAAIGALGVYGILQHPEVLWAIDPRHGVQFLFSTGWKGFLVLGSVFLVITGGEALYADMGHFGRIPIRNAWFYFALPGLVLNYFGQGALLIFDPSAAENPFYHLCPRELLYPMIVLATLASIIASQAVISGAFSLTRQAVQLGYLPRLVIHHTSSEEIGQIYIPRINWMLLAATVWLVLEFRSSANLAGAYGIAVATTMVITTILMFTVCRNNWKWGLFSAGTLWTLFFIIDFAFFAANLAKIGQGGWFPILIGITFFTIMTTWRQGRKLLFERLQNRTIPIVDFLQRIKTDPPIRIPGTAIFMSGQGDGTPPALFHNVKHNKVLHERVVIMMVATENSPHVSVEDRLQVEKLDDNFYRITAFYGFKDTPNVPGALRLAKNQGVDFSIDEATFYLGRETLLPTRRPGMAIWREKLFATLSANAERATAFFKIPPEQVVEIGMQVEL